MVIMAASSGALPFLIQKVADEIFVARNERLLFILPAAILVLMCVRAIADWVATVADAWIGTHVVAELRLRMFGTLAHADLGWLQATHSGRFVSAFVTDAPIVDRAGTKTLTSLLKNGLSVLFLVGAMIYLDWRLSLLVMAGMPIVMLNLGRQRIRIRRSVKRSLEESGDLGSMLTQTLQSMRVVKAYRQEEHEGERFRRITTNIMKYLMKTARSRAAVGPVSEAVSGLGLAAAVLYGGWQGIYGNVSLGHFMGFITAAMLAYQPLKGLAVTHAVLSEGLLAAGRVFALIDHPARVAEARDARPLAVSAGAISFQNVDFSYGEESPVLRNFSL
ncbi:MAG TPA: ABC transporter transmembrane domain-containing protein, partial [Bradyrhizobium sp.]|nr:ABC transporter transmembrane domain-containing protein [Bradyrhizobium sp.]